MEFALSIAVIHHFSSIERRQQAIREITRVLKVHGEALIFVWAYEQNDKRFDFKDQDVMIPWHLSKTFQKTQTQVFHRYYHLFKQGELKSLVESVSWDGCKSVVIREGYDRDNWYVVIKRIE
jgi:tRNA (uracil-5-)-methyltransferase TRM9